MDKQTNGLTVNWTNRQLDNQSNGQTISGQVNQWTVRLTYKQSNSWTSELANGPSDYDKQLN